MLNAIWRPVRNQTFAVDGDASFCVLTDVEELSDDGIIRCAPVYEEKVVMLEPRLCEAPGIIHLLIKSDDGCDVVFPKVWDVGLRSVQRVPWDNNEQKKPTKKQKQKTLWD